jgi:hypothetical protein
MVACLYKKNKRGIIGEWEYVPHRKDVVVAFNCLTSLSGQRPLIEKRGNDVYAYYRHCGLVG